MKKYPILIVFIAGTCLLSVLGIQSYLIFDYFSAIRSSLMRESDAIVEQIFLDDLNLRNKQYSHLSGSDTLSTPPPQTEENTLYINLGEKEIGQDAISEQMNIIINMSVSGFVPMSMQSLDSIARSILISRNINSDFVVQHIHFIEGKPIETPLSESFFSIRSKLQYLNLDKTEALQLVLLNPFGIILKRMGLMLASSFVLILICIFAFVVLFRILGKQKQLINFKNDFLSNIAHELKRPVASLSFNMDCLRMPQFYSNDNQRELCIDRASNSVEELNDNINMIVTLAKLEEGLLKLEIQPFDLSETIRGLKERFMNNSSKQIAIDITDQSDKKEFRGDKKLLVQCFANLIDNAIKYSNNDSVQIDILIKAENDNFIVSIKDNGQGIAEDKLDTLFDKYTRANETNTIRGFGIGLNYVKTIVEKHKGSVSVKSQLGQGSEFTVILPN